MNIITGEIREITKDIEELFKEKEEWVELQGSLEDKAREELKNKEELFIDLKADSELAKFAQKERYKMNSKKRAKTKKRRKIARASRKKNRRNR